MISEEFKQFIRKVDMALANEGFYPGTYQLLNIASDLFVEPKPVIDYSTYKNPALVRIALEDDGSRAVTQPQGRTFQGVSVRGYIEAGKKIEAIVRLRLLSGGATLKETKEAVEEISVF